MVFSFMAGKNTSVSLSDHYLAFAEAKVREGRYGSTSEVIRAGLRLLEAEEQKLEALRAAIQEGLDSGPARPFDWDAFMQEKFGPEPNA
jgi:antitoxin ParD1/3/4